MINPEIPGLDLSVFDIAVDLSALKTSDEIYESCKASPTAFENWFSTIEALQVRSPKTKTIPLGIDSIVTLNVATAIWACAGVGIKTDRINSVKEKYNTPLNTVTKPILTG